MPFIAGGIALAGGLMSSASQRSAASQASDAQIKAAQIAAEAAKFKPIGTTTRFGSSQFGYSPSGELTSAGYTMSPELKAQQDLLMSGAGGALNQAGMNAAAGQGLFGLGAQYAATSPQEAAAQWMKQQQDILRPGQEQAYAALQQNLQNTGRGGLSIAQGGDLAAANPEAAAYYNALAKQQALLAGQATQMGQQQAQYGAGLMETGLGLQSTAYNPYKTQFGLAQSLEGAAQQPYGLSSELAGRTSTANQFGASGLMAAENTAANRNYTANATSPWGTGAAALSNNPQFISGVSNWLNPPTQQGPVSMPGYGGMWDEANYMGR